MRSQTPTHSYDGATFPFGSTNCIRFRGYHLSSGLKFYFRNTPKVFDGSNVNRNFEMQRIFAGKFPKYALVIWHFRNTSPICRNSRLP